MLSARSRTIPDSSTDLPAATDGNPHPLLLVNEQVQTSSSKRKLRTLESSAARKVLRMGWITSRPSWCRSTSLCEIRRTLTATEQEKADYFTQQHTIPVSDFPAKVYRSPKGKTETVRYFVDKFPLFLSPTAVVYFTFVSAGGLRRLAEFRTHLRLYGRLFKHLKEVRMVFIHQDSFHVSAAEACFRAAIKASDESHIESAGLLRYFELRQAWNRREYEKVGSEELVFLKQAQSPCENSSSDSRDHATLRYALVQAHGSWRPAAIPGARFVPIENRNHLILEQEPIWPQYVETIRRFLDSEASFLQVESKRRPGRRESNARSSASRKHLCAAPTRRTHRQIAPHASPLGRPSARCD